jgi:hypothetical protein
VLSARKCKNNCAQVLNPLTEITFAEYAEPAFVGPITWTDLDGDLAQLFLVESNSSEHTFNDTMLSISYDSFTSAQVQTFAILGDRGEREFEFLVSDGQTNSEVQRVPVTVTSNYIVPQPLPDLPDFHAFYTVRESGELRRIDQTGEDQLVGLIPDYTPDFSTVYRRSDTGWLYFVDQTAQRIIVVDETTAQVVFTIALNHEPNRENDQHKQTVYLIWWRPAEFDTGGNMTRAGRLEGLLESKQSQDTDGDWYMTCRLSGRTRAGWTVSRHGVQQPVSRLRTPPSRHRQSVCAGVSHDGGAGASDLFSQRQFGIAASAPVLLPGTAALSGDQTAPAEDQNPVYVGRDGSRQPRSGAPRVHAPLFRGRPPPDRDRNPAGGVDSTRGRDVLWPVGLGL